MSGGVIFHSWNGPGNAYPFPTNPSSELITADMRSRWLPYRDASMAHMITSGSPQNQSGTSWESQHAGLQNADETARSENFKF